jgi:hypothetical protein
MRRLWCPDKCRRQGGDADGEGHDANGRRRIGVGVTTSRAARHLLRRVAAIRGTLAPLSESAMTGAPRYMAVNRLERQRCVPT